MEKYIVITGTITYAIKGRDLLRRAGYKASIERVTSGDRIGCGYGIFVFGNIKNIRDLLEENLIKILDIRIAH
jgi:hypothetical protein